MNFEKQKERPDKLSDEYIREKPDRSTDGYTWLPPPDRVIPGDIFPDPETEPEAA